MNLTFGIELEFADLRTSVLRRALPSGWECQGDNSIQNTDGSWSDHLNPSAMGTEAKTIGGLALETLIEQLPVLYKLVADKGGSVNRTTGIHVHVAFGDWDADRLLSLFKYFVDQPSFAKAVGCSKRRFAKQCCRVSAKHMETVQANISDLPRLKQLSERVNLIHVPLRQLEVNVLSLLHHGTIEYRAFNQTMDVQRAINCARYADEVTRAALSGLPLPKPTYPLPEPL